MNNKGFTLIEIIIAIALIGIISVSFLTLLTSHFTWIVNTKSEVTQTAFDNQSDMEDKISAINQILLEGDSPSADLYDSTIDLMLFSDAFSEADFPIRNHLLVYKIIEETGGRKGFTTLLGETRLAPLPVPKVDITSINMVRNGVVSSDPNDFAEYYNNNLSIKTNVLLVDNPNNCFYRNKHEWFVSNPGFLIPVPDESAIDIDEDWSRIYPLFPRDFSPVPINDPSINAFMTNTLSSTRILSNPGRHMVYRVTPYSKDLKKGDELFSRPVFVSGPVYTEGLIWHLEASLLDKTDNNIFQEIDNYFYLQEWNNLRYSFIAPTGSKGIPVDGRRPVLASVPEPENEFYIGPEIPFQGEDLASGKVWGRALRNYDDSSMASMTFNDFPTGNTGFTLYAVIRKVVDPMAPDTSSYIFKGISGDEKSWELGWTDDYKLQWSAEYKPEDEESPNEGEPPFEYSLPEKANVDMGSDEWYVLELLVEESIDDKALGTARVKLHNLNLDNVANIVEDSGEYYSIDSNELNIIWNGIELAEVLLYNKALGGESDTVYDYLMNKYRGL